MGSTGKVTEDWRWNIAIADKCNIYKGKEVIP